MKNLHIFFWKDASGFGPSHNLQTNTFEDPAQTIRSSMADAEAGQAGLNWMGWVDEIDWAGIIVFGVIQALVLMSLPKERQTIKAINCYQSSTNNCETKQLH